MAAIAILLVIVQAIILSPLVECSSIRCQVEDGRPWSYHGLENGPSSWGVNYPNCYGRKQSPIEIHSYEEVQDSSLKHLKLKNYDISVKKATIENNGHSVQMTPQDGVVRSIVSNGTVFNLAQLHFHWGHRYDQGSEHTIHERRYALEAHFVHTNNSQIAVVGVLFQEVKDNNTAFNPIGEILPRLLFKHNTTSLSTNLDLNGLLPKNPLPIYRYQGSLTTPACTEGVIWSVSQGIANIGKLQMTDLRKLYSAERNEAYAGCKINDNFRPIQPLNGRKILVST